MESSHLDLLEDGSRDRYIRLMYILESQSMRYMLRKEDSDSYSISLSP